MKVWVVLTTYDRDSYEESWVSVHRTEAGARLRCGAILYEFTPSEISTEISVSVEEQELQE